MHKYIYSCVDLCMFTGILIEKLYMYIYIQIHI